MFNGSQLFSFDSWDHLPKWVQFGLATAFLGHSTRAAINGVLWPLGFGIGIVLLILSFRKSPQVIAADYFDGDTSEPAALEMIPIDPDEIDRLEPPSSVAERPTGD